MKYLVTRTHTETYEVEIEAPSMERALEMARDQEIDPDDYDCVDAGYYEYEAEEIEDEDIS